MLESRDLLTTHSASDERHYHDDVAQPEGDPADQKCLVHNEQRAAAFCVVLAWKIQRESENDEVFFYSFASLVGNTFFCALQF